LSKEYVRLNNTVVKLESLKINLKDIGDFFELSFSEGDSSVELDLLSDLKIIDKTISKIEIESLFVNEVDICNAFLDIKAGAGGIESHDWANMLFKMYVSWINKNKYVYEVLNIVPGDIVGIKSVSLKILGKFSFGWLKCESGIHRLVRKSPFDLNNKRHTSFSSVFVYPDNIKNDILKINDFDLKIDTFRSSGAGGQHVNKTESAVRITHLPTSLTVKCQSNRSQHKNKEQALVQLKAKLIELNLLKTKLNKDKVNSNKVNITWGNQIRSYVLDKSIIKDLRTNIEVNNVDVVLNGDLYPFMYALLRKKNF